MQPLLLLKKEAALRSPSISRFEWPTALLMVVTYLVWAAGTFLWPSHPILAMAITAWAIAQFSSLQHEVLHGHPFRNQTVNEALVFPALTLWVPFRRFRDLHLLHHHDPALTDPYDDPESNYLDPDHWQRLGPVVKWILRWNNTLLGRMVIGPVLATTTFLRNEAALVVKGDPLAVKAWLLHGGAVAMVLGWLLFWHSMTIPAYLAASYLAMALLRIRTFLEHRAHATCRGRTVVIEDRGPLALLFLNNNFHAVHHMHPHLPWYGLPAAYASQRDYYLRRNDGYVYESYGQIFRQYLLWAKDPVPHPIWPVNPRTDTRPGSAHSFDQSSLRNAGLGPELSKNGTPG